jgi:hypothetical protein
MHGPDDQPKNSPGRQAAIQKHVAALNSGNPRKIQNAQRHLRSLNASWAERHTAIDSLGVPQSDPAKSAQRSVKINGKRYKTDTLGVPQHTPGSAFNIGHMIGHEALDAATGNPFGSKTLESIQAGHVPGMTAARQDLEKGTGYHEIAHIHNHPIAGSLALAGILPFGRVAKLGELGVDAARGVNTAEHAVKVAQAAEEAKGLKKVVLSRRAVRLARRGNPRTEAQAAAHVADVAKKARQQGFGRVLPKISKLKPGEVTPETGGEAGRIVRQGLHPNFKGMGKFEKVGATLDNPGIGVLRKQQEELRAVERSQRAGAIERASAGKSGLARHVAAKAALEGKLPARVFNGFSELTPELRDQAINHIYDHPHFQPYEKVRAADALDEAIAGKVVTEGDQKLLERAFGKEEAAGLMASIKSGGFRDTLANIANVPRSIMASGDLSAPFRQGLVVMASHPAIFFKGFAPMLHAAHSEEFFQAGIKSIHDMPEFPLMEKAHVALTDIGETAKGAENINKREEQFASNLAEQIPGIGHMVRGSDRAYVLFLNQTRARLFSHLVHQAASEGWHLNDKLTEDIAKFVNSATGRGDLGKLGEHTATLNALFFSPRLMASRFNFLNPVYYLRMEPFARRQALKAALRLAGTMNAVLFFAKMGGANVVTDPRNADFGKIRVGNTRLDLAGGFTQPIRLIDQLYTGQVISSTSGKLENLSSTGFGRSRFDVAMQFLENKASPVPSAVIDALKGGQFGQKFNPKSELAQRMIPLLWQDIYQIERSTGPKGAVGYGLPDLFGVGVQNYGPPKKKSTSGGSFGSRGSTNFGGSSGSSFP